MKPGDQINCPHCGMSSFLKKESVMDGWKKAGEVLKCASCSAKIADLPPEVLAREEDKAAKSRADKLQSLLGGVTVSKPKLEAKPGERRFCRDCANLVAHPFLSRCSLHNKEVNPMDDCPDFKPKIRKEGPK